MRAALLAASALAGAVMASPAHATGGIACNSPDETVSVEIGIGHVAGLAVVGATIDAAGKTWAMAGMPEARTITVSQAFGQGGHTWIDFADAIVNEIVAELRLVRVDEGDDTGFGGTLRMPGIGAWTLICFEG